MTAHDDILVKWYEGELGGNALFSRLRDVATPQAASKWAALALVEEGVASALAKVLSKRDIHASVPQTLESRAEARGASLTGKSWMETMQWLRTIAADALQGMHADARTLPADLAQAGEMVISHEQALLDFAELELAGREADARARLELFLGCLNNENK